MNYLDLFSGIGGFALGAYWAGWRFDRHYFSEIDPWCCRLYQQRFPDAVPLGDIREIDGKTLVADAEYGRREHEQGDTSGEGNERKTALPSGDGWILTGGFPCQDISVAGKGAGIEGFARDCGLSTRGSLAKYDRGTRSWRTSARSLDGDLIEFSGALPKSGTMRSGVIYELPTSERRTAGKESGLWPTPDASEGEKGGPNRRDGKGRPYLSGAVARFNLWRTPSADENGSIQTEDERAGRQIMLSNQVGGQLNPTWVEWLMGYPLGWTDSGDSATRLSLRSQR